MHVTIYGQAKTRVISVPDSGDNRKKAVIRKRDSPALTSATTRSRSPRRLDIMEQLQVEARL